MQQTSKNSTSKEVTTLSISQDLLAEAQGLKINLSVILEKALIKEIGEIKRKRWLEENREKIQSCNALAKENGLFSDQCRVL